ncbi:MAG: hypothetical protein NVS3B20_23200 [Polyangiales bacterium]
MILGFPTVLLCVYALGTAVLLNRRPPGWDWATRLFGRWMLLHGALVLVIYAVHLASVTVRAQGVMTTLSWKLVDRGVGPVLVPLMAMVAVGGWYLRKTRPDEADSLPDEDSR